MDHVDFSHRRLPDSFPRIEVWKQNMIRDCSDLDLKSGSVYGMRPLLDFEKTCYHKVWYIDQFVALVDDLKAYAKHPDPLYYTQRLIDGLRDDIKAVILVQGPSTLITSCALAQLQEEASDGDC